MRTTNVGRISAAVLALTACSSTGAAPASDAGPARSAACVAQDTLVQRTLDTALAATSGPSAVIAVRNAACGTAVYVSNVGYYVAKQASLWRIGSVTKTYVSASILSLVKDGKLTLEDPLSKWVPNVAGTTGVTVLMLLDHRSGIFDYSYAGLFDYTKAWTPQQLVDLAVAEPPYFAPDAGYHYSSTNYVLLGMILEAVTGQKAGEVLHARAIGAAKLENTLFDGFDEVDPALMGHGFQGSDVTFSWNPSCSWTAGAMVASAADLATWVTTLYGSDTVLDASQRATLSSKTSDCSADWGTGCTYGLGVFLNDASYWTGHAGPSLGHWGGVVGYSTAAFYFPNQESAVVSIMNNSNTGSAQANHAIEQAVVTALFP